MNRVFDRRAVRRPDRTAPVRMLALDIDGTILDGRGHLRAAVRDAIRHVAAAGIHVVLATGRSPWYGVAELAAILGLRGTQLTMQGALAIDPASGQMERIRSLPSDVFSDGLAFAREQGIEPIVSTLAGHRAVRVPDAVDFLPASPMPGTFQLEADLERVVAEGPMRLFLPTGSGRHRQVRLAAQERFLGRAAVVWGDLSGVELIAHGVNKGEAIAWYARSRGWDLDAVAAAGDASNDTEMLRAAGRSAAMGSAPPEVREAADIVVPSSDQDGLLDALAWFLPGLVTVAGRRSTPGGGVGTGTGTGLSVGSGAGAATRPEPGSLSLA